MKIVGIYSFKGGQDTIASKYPAELEEVKQVIATVDSTKCKTKTSREKTMLGKTLYSPRALNRAFTQEFGLHGWKNTKFSVTIQPITMYLTLSQIVHPKQLFVRWILPKTVWELKFNLGSMLSWFIMSVRK